MTMPLSAVVPIAVRPVLGSITTTPPPHRQSQRLDLRHALAASEVPELLAQLSGRKSAKPWHKWAPPLVLFQGLTGPQLARLRTNDLVFIHGHGWLSVPRAGDAEASDGPPLMVPLHPALIAAEFHGFSHSRFFEAGEETFLFPDLAQAARPGDAVESWLRRATRVWSDEGRHAPTLCDLRATAAQAALDGGAPVHMVEAWMGLEVPVWDDRAPCDAEARVRVLRDWVWEAVDAVRYPTPSHTRPQAAGLSSVWSAVLDADAPIVMPRRLGLAAEGKG